MAGILKLILWMNGGQLIHTDFLFLGDEGKVCESRLSSITFQWVTASRPHFTFSQVISWSVSSLSHLTQQFQFLKAQVFKRYHLPHPQVKFIVCFPHQPFDQTKHTHVWTLPTSPPPQLRKDTAGQWRCPYTQLTIATF